MCFFKVSCLLFTKVDNLWFVKLGKENVLERLCRRRNYLGMITLEFLSTFDAFYRGGVICVL